MDELYTLWTEKNYQELSRRCQELLAKQPENHAVKCLYAGSRALACTLMHPTLPEASQTFEEGFAGLKAENPEPSALTQALARFCQALDLADHNLQTLFVPVCKYEASVEELRRCKALFAAAAENALSLYTPDMLKNQDEFLPSYLAFCRLGLRTAEEYCLTRGVEKLTAKKSFLSVSIVPPENRASMVERYDRLVQTVQRYKPEFLPADSLERTQPTPEQIQAVVQDFRHYLNPEEAADHAHAASQEEGKPAGSLFHRLFR